MFHIQSKAQYCNYQAPSFLTKPYLKWSKEPQKWQTIRQQSASVSLVREGKLMHKASTLPSHLLSHSSHENETNFATTTRISSIELYTLQPPLDKCTQTGPTNRNEFSFWRPYDLNVVCSSIDRPSIKWHVKTEYICWSFPPQGRYRDSPEWDTSEYLCWANWHSPSETSTESSKSSGSPISLHTLKMARSGSDFDTDMDRIRTNRSIVSSSDAVMAADSRRVISMAFSVNLQ